jgi:PAS domain S-box-containing protein
VSTERTADEFSEFFRTAPVPIQLVGAGGIILEANDAQLAMLGYRAEEYVGRRVTEFHVDAGVGADLAERLGGAEPLRDFEARLRGADGVIHHVRITATIRRDDARGPHACCFARDLTDARSAERRLAVQYRVAQILTAGMDTPEALRRTLAAVCEELGWDVGEIWRRDDGAEALRLAASVQRPGLDAHALVQRGLETPFARGRGLPGHVWATMAPVWIDDVSRAPLFERAAAAEVAGLRVACGVPITLGGEVSGVMVYLRREREPADEATIRMLRLIAGQVEQFLDHTRVEDKRERLLELERTIRVEAEAANRAKDEFLAGVSHELRTPLHAILGWSRLLRGGALDAETVERGLAAVERNAEIQEQLISDLLDVARIVTGKIQLRLAPIDLAGVVDAAVDAVRHTAAAKRLTLDVRLEAGIPPTLGDGARLQQVVWNLLSNAIRFTAEGGHIRVTLRSRGSRAVIEVADDGIGIAGEFLPHVFERFRQGDMGTTRRQRGLGLGLSIVRHLAELHGGLVRAESEGEGRGATFTVELPVTEPVPMLAAAAPASAEVVPGCLEHVRILIVDDDADARELLGMVLRQHGAEVTGAASAEAAIAAFRRDAPDVVLSDIGLPDADGCDLIRRLRALDLVATGTAVAVALTGWARSEDREAALEAGFQAHVAKPVDPAELVALLARLVTGRRPTPVDGTGLAAA